MGRGGAIKFEDNHRPTPGCQVQGGCFFEMFHTDIQISRSIIRKTRPVKIEAPPNSADPNPDNEIPIAVIESISLTASNIIFNIIKSPFIYLVITARLLGKQTEDPIDE